MNVYRACLTIENKKCRSKGNDTLYTFSDGRQGYVCTRHLNALNKGDDVNLNDSLIRTPEVWAIGRQVQLTANIGEAALDVENAPTPIDKEVPMKFILVHHYLLHGDHFDVFTIGKSTNRSINEAKEALIIKQKDFALGFSSNDREHLILIDKKEGKVRRIHRTKVTIRHLITCPNCVGQGMKPGQYKCKTMVFDRDLNKMVNSIGTCYRCRDHIGLIVEPKTTPTPAPAAQDIDLTSINIADLAND